MRQYCGDVCAGWSSRVSKLEGVVIAEDVTLQSQRDDVIVIAVTITHQPEELLRGCLSVSRWLSTNQNHALRVVE